MGLLSRVSSRSTGSDKKTYKNADGPGGTTNDYGPGPSGRTRGGAQSLTPDPIAHPEYFAPDDPGNDVDLGIDSQFGMGPTKMHRKGTLTPEGAASYDQTEGNVKNRWQQIFADPRFKQMGPQIESLAHSGDPAKMKQAMMMHSQLMQQMRDLWGMQGASQQQQDDAVRPTSALGASHGPGRPDFGGGGAGVDSAMSAGDDMDTLRQASGPGAVAAKLAALSGHMGGAGGITGFDPGGGDPLPDGNDGRMDRGGAAMSLPPGLLQMLQAMRDHGVSGGMGQPGGMTTMDFRPERDLNPDQLVQYRQDQDIRRQFADLQAAGDPAATAQFWNQHRDVFQGRDGGRGAAEYGRGLRGGGGGFAGGASSGDGPGSGIDPGFIAPAMRRWRDAPLGTDMVGPRPGGFANIGTPPLSDADLKRSQGMPEKFLKGY